MNISQPKLRSGKFDDDYDGNGDGDVDDDDDDDNNNRPDIIIKIIIIGQI
jgi:hypothetical protein